MSEENNKSLVPHIAIGAVVIVILAAVIFWPSEPDAPEVVEPAVTVIEAPEPEPVIDTPVDQPLTEESAEQLDVEEQPVLEPEVQPEPLDTSDGAVKTQLLALSDYQEFGRLIVNEGLLQRFVITTNSLADEALANSNRVLTPPDKPFRTYQQADKQWIDPASFKRYTPYVEVLESVNTNELLLLYSKYKGAIDGIFAEISSPSDSFNDKLNQAIDELLDTPEVPMPIEVYTDSVMYKFADPQLESLSAPQKQLLRTGPDNMRRIKAKLREIKQAL